MAVKEKIRVRLKSYDHQLVDAAAEKIVEAANSLAREFGVSVGTANRLVRAGYVTVDGIREAGLQSLLEIEKING